MHAHHAIVIGASMSGLVAARVLSGRFGQVTIVDRDALPAAVDNRRGVPQGRHGHGILASGMRGMTSLFPNLERELLAAGALRGDVVGTARWFQHGHYKAKFQSGLDALLLSWGHDEYLYHVLRPYLPPPALAVIRYHSFYAWHSHGAYAHLLAPEDEEKRVAVRRFNPFDLYSKSELRPSWPALRGYYEPLVAESLPAELQW